MSDIVPANHELALSELLDRVLNKGVVVTGDLTISIANVDLIYVGLKVLACSVETAGRLGCAPLGRTASKAPGERLPGISGESPCSISTA